jgi:hypothetical protein
VKSRFRRTKSEAPQSMVFLLFHARSERHGCGSLNARSRQYGRDGVGREEHCKSSVCVARRAAPNPRTASASPPLALWRFCVPRRAASNPHTSSAPPPLAQRAKGGRRPDSRRVAIPLSSKSCIESSHSLRPSTPGPAGQGGAGLRTCGDSKRL